MTEVVKYVILKFLSLLGEFFEDKEKMNDLTEILNIGLNTF